MQMNAGNNERRMGVVYWRAQKELKDDVVVVKKARHKIYMHR